MDPTAADRAWFEQAVLQVLPELLATARRLTRSSADAEDLAADAITRAWLHRSSLRERDRFPAWIHRILTNLFLSRRRTEANRPEEASLDEAEDFSLFERLHQPFLLWWGTPEQEFLNRLLRDDLIVAIEALPDRYRIVVVLADVQGLSYGDIAGSLEVPIGTVRSRLARGRALLQKALWDHACDAGLRTRPLHQRPEHA
ncbi:MAG TPA: sigma-70 family RNA polymerase sigma factor [Gemmatimonadales bacterium]|jgi:RNA polymerase sigma-70 factor (ECF subfamily)|nr:sigma-70 family RNA polymerase sigma factor [Gemmatimonadales bacterium]